MNTIVTNLRQSTERASEYWRALRRRAISRFNIGDDIVDFPLKSVVWPHLVYRREPVSLSQLGDWLADEHALISGFEVRCPAQLQLEMELALHPRFAYASAFEIPDVAREKLHDALELIAALWPEAYVEMQALLLAVAWTKTNSGLRSTSDPKKFGLVHVDAQYYSKASFLELTTALIHECAHHALFVESTLDPLIASDFRRMIYSPLRKEMRPAIGVLHSLFASSRILQWAERLKQRRQHVATMDEVKRVAFLYGSSVESSLDLVRDCGLTPSGQRIVEDISDFRGVFPRLAYG